MEHRLYRSRTDKMVAGVCGGIAEYFDIDPVIVRAIFLALALAKGIGVVVYFAFWLIVPEAPIGSEPAKRSLFEETVEGVKNKAEDRAASREERRQRRQERYSGGAVGGLILIALGFLFLAHNFFDIAFGALWPLLLIALGLGIILRKERP